MEHTWLLQDLEEPGADGIQRLEGFTCEPGGAANGRAGCDECSAAVVVRPTAQLAPVPVADPAAGSADTRRRASAIPAKALHPTAPPINALPPAASSFESKIGSAPPQDAARSLLSAFWLAKIICGKAAKVSFLAVTPCFFNFERTLIELPRSCAARRPRCGWLLFCCQGLSCFAAKVHWNIDWAARVQVDEAGWEEGCCACAASGGGAPSPHPSTFARMLAHSQFLSCPTCPCCPALQSKQATRRLLLFTRNPQPLQARCCTRLPAGLALVHCLPAGLAGQGSCLDAPPACFLCPPLQRGGSKLSWAYTGCFSMAQKLRHSVPLTRLALPQVYQKRLDYSSEWCAWARGCCCCRCRRCLFSRATRQGTPVLPWCTCSRWRWLASASPPHSTPHRRKQLKGHINSLRDARSALELYPMVPPGQPFPLEPFWRAVRAGSLFRQPCLFVSLPLGTPCWSLQLAAARRQRAWRPCCAEPCAVPRMPCRAQSCAAAGVHQCSSRHCVPTFLCVLPAALAQVLLELRGQSDADFEELDEGTQVNRIQVWSLHVILYVPWDSGRRHAGQHGKGAGFSGVCFCVFFLGIPPAGREHAGQQDTGAASVAFLCFQLL